MCSYGFPVLNDFDGVGGYFIKSCIVFYILAVSASVIMRNARWEIERIDLTYHMSDFYNNSLLNLYNHTKHQITVSGGGH